MTRVAMAILLATAPLATGCELGDGAAASRLAATAAADAPVYVSIASRGDDAAAPLSLDLSAPDKTFGVAVCEGDAREACAKGHGRFLTSDFDRALAGRRVYRANVTIAPQDGARYVAVAYDESGALLASSTIELKGR